MGGGDVGGLPPSSTSLQWGPCAVIYDYDFSQMPRTQRHNVLTIKGEAFKTLYLEMVQDLHRDFRYSFAGMDLHPHTVTATDPEETSGAVLDQDTSEFDPNPKAEITPESDLRPDTQVEDRLKAKTEEMEADYNEVDVQQLVKDIIERVSQLDLPATVLGHARHAASKLVQLMDEGIPPVQKREILKRVYFCTTCMWRHASFAPAILLNSLHLALHQMENSGHPDVLWMLVLTADGEEFKSSPKTHLSCLCFFEYFCWGPSVLC